ncbi:hypothetical protein DTO027I6_10033 [Penicillium roqueforti]|nr:hypothetical protein CBS147337_10239 [Penicillium roqueforti]KAI3184047.1 hypothetical protein DTO027I6_10033 [Penicillium roqueforti]
MKFWTLLALAASAAAFPLEGPVVQLHKRDGVRKHIGYRVATKAEADAINENGGKAVQSLGTGGRQLGTGTYISPRFQDFPDFDRSKGIPWDCVVTIDADVWDGWNKAWIPKFFEFPEDKEKNPDKCEPLPIWTPRYKTNRARFLKYLEASMTADNTVLFSKVLHYEEKDQALIPPALIDTGEVYLAQCAERETDANAQIGKMGSKDWDTQSMPGWGLGIDA